jgi:glutamate 5-kinase
MRSVIHAASRIVVKVGSSLVTNDGKDWTWPHWRAGLPKLPN